MSKGKSTLVTHREKPVLFGRGRPGTPVLYETLPQNHASPFALLILIKDFYQNKVIYVKSYCSP